MRCLCYNKNGGSLVAPPGSIRYLSSSRRIKVTIAARSFTALAAIEIKSFDFLINSTPFPRHTNRMCRSCYNPRPKEDACTASLQDGAQ